MIYAHKISTCVNNCKFVNYGYMNQQQVHKFVLIFVRYANRFIVNMLQDKLFLIANSN